MRSSTVRARLSRPGLTWPDSLSSRNRGRRLPRREKSSGKVRKQRLTQTDLWSSYLVTWKWKSYFIVVFLVENLHSITAHIIHRHQQNYLIMCVISYQKKKLRKPKESASLPSESFNMHFSLRGMGRGGERGGDQFKWCQIRGAPEHPSLISNQRGWVFHDGVFRTGKKRVKQSEM